MYAYFTYLSRGKNSRPATFTVSLGGLFFALGSLSERQPPALLVGKAEHKPYQKKPPKEQPFQLLVDIQGKMAEGKIVSYKKWATKFNLKEMSKTLLFLQEQKIGSAEELRERAAAATERYHAMGDSIKAAEVRLAEIAVLKTHIINYAKTREVYAAYRKAGYSKAFLEAHREEITLHKAAKAAFDEAGLQKLPRVKELDAEFAELLTKKKAAYGFCLFSQEFGILAQTAVPHQLFRWQRTAVHYAGVEVGCDFLSGD